MKLDVPVRTLGPVDHLALKKAVCAVAPEIWDEDQLRQKAFAEHAQTRSIILLFCEGWPQIKVSQRNGWQYFNNEASALISQIISRHYPPGGIVIRAMLAKLLAGGEIPEHIDAHPSFAHAHRIHVPLVTNDLVDFAVDGTNHHLNEGIAYEISNLDYHFVANRSAQDRIHFIFDYAVRRPA